MKTPVTFISQSMVKLAGDWDPSQHQGGGWGPLRSAAGAGFDPSTVRPEKVKNILEIFLRTVGGAEGGQPGNSAMDKMLADKRMNRFTGGLALGGAAGAIGGGLHNYLKSEEDEDATRNTLRGALGGGAIGALGGGALGGLYGLEAPRAVWNETPLGKELPVSLPAYVKALFQ